MNRLQTELARLYGYAGAEVASGGSPGPLIDAQGQVRALVIELARPASWEQLGRVWRGVQTELELPAPGIAVSGTDGLQLWFSLARPLRVDPAHGFLQAIRTRFLPEVPARRIALRPGPAADAQGGPIHARAVPARDAATGNWSAFVAADLAPVFAETPWLDVAPNDEGQATLLRALESIKPAVLEAAWQKLGWAASPVDAISAPPAVPCAGNEPVASAHTDARRFLQSVMNDADAPLALRIDAAKALLPPSRN